MFMYWKTPAMRGMIRQYTAATIVNIGMMLGGEYFGWPSPTLPKLEEANIPFGMNHREITWMVSFLYVGHAISPIPSGYLMDYYGRKKSLIYLSIFPVCSWLLTLLATCPMHLYIARILGGLWVGIITTVAPMYSSEIAEPKIRGALGNVFSVTTYVGVLFVYVVGYYVSYYTLAVVAGISSIVFLLLLLLVPESPYYFLIHKDKKRATEALRWLRGGIEEDKLEMEVNTMEETIQKQMENKGSIRTIFKSRANRKAFLIVELYAIFVRFSGTGLMMAFSSITLPKTAFKSLGTKECTITIASVWVISSVCSLALVDWLGRKVLLVVSSSACSVATFVVGLWFYLSTTNTVDLEDYNWVPFICFIFHGMLYCLGMGPVGTAIKGELLSADIRASVSAITTIVFAFSSLLLNQTYLPIADSIGMYANYWLYSANCFICTLFTIFVFVETKGKTLQEIQDRLSKTKSKKNIHLNDTKNVCRLK